VHRWKVRLLSLVNRPGILEGRARVALLFD
jgi:hypothetical protein